MTEMGPSLADSTSEQLGATQTQMTETGGVSENDISLSSRQSASNTSDSAISTSFSASESNSSKSSSLDDDSSSTISSVSLEANRNSDLHHAEQRSETEAEQSAGGSRLTRKLSPGQTADERQQQATSFSPDNSNQRSSRHPQPRWGSWGGKANLVPRQEENYFIKCDQGPYFDPRNPQTLSSISSHELNLQFLSSHQHVAHPPPMPAIYPIMGQGFCNLMHMNSAQCSINQPAIYTAAARSHLIPQQVALHNLHGRQTYDLQTLPNETTLQYYQTYPISYLNDPSACAENKHHQLARFQCEQQAKSGTVEDAGRSLCCCTSSPGTPEHFDDAGERDRASGYTGAEDDEGSEGRDDVQSRKSPLVDAKDYTQKDESNLGFRVSQDRSFDATTRPTCVEDDESIRSTPTHPANIEAPVTSGDLPVASSSSHTPTSIDSVSPISEGASTRGCHTSSSCQQVSNGEGRCSNLNHVNQHQGPSCSGWHNDQAQQSSVQPSSIHYGVQLLAPECSAFMPQPQCSQLQQKSVLLTPHQLTAQYQGHDLAPAVYSHTVQPHQYLSLVRAHNPELPYVNSLTTNQLFIPATVNELQHPDSTYHLLDSFSQPFAPVFIGNPIGYSFPPIRCPLGLSTLPFGLYPPVQPPYAPYGPALANSNVHERPQGFCSAGIQTSQLVAFGQPLPAQLQTVPAYCPKISCDLFVSLLPIDATPTKTRQAYGMNKVWQDEFEQLFSQLTPDIHWTLLEVESNPSIRDANCIVGYRGHYIIAVDWPNLAETTGNLSDCVGKTRTSAQVDGSEASGELSDDDCKSGCAKTPNSTRATSPSSQSTNDSGEPGTSSDVAESDNCDSGLQTDSTSLREEAAQSEKVADPPPSKAAKLEAQVNGRRVPTKFRMFIDSAKVRFCCDKCGHGWTSMKGRVVFWYELFELADQSTFRFNDQSRSRPFDYNMVIGYCTYKLFGQQCDVCKIENKFERPMWYPEEVTKVLNNLYNKIGQVYFGFKMQVIDKQRRAGKPKTPHNSSLCQACHDGLCTDRK